MLNQFSLFFQQKKCHFELDINVQGEGITYCNTVNCEASSMNQPSIVLVCVSFIELLSIEQVIWLQFFIFTLLYDYACNMVT